MEDCRRTLRFEGVGVEGVRLTLGSRVEGLGFEVSGLGLLPKPMGQFDPTRRKVRKPDNNEQNKRLLRLLCFRVGFRVSGSGV